MSADGPRCGCACGFGRTRQQQQQQAGEERWQIDRQAALHLPSHPAHPPEDELLERLQLQPPPQHALHRGHARVGPPLHQPLLHKPGELALGQHGIDEGQPVQRGWGGQRRVLPVRSERALCVCLQPARSALCLPHTFSCKDCRHDHSKTSRRSRRSRHGRRSRQGASSPRVVPDVHVRQPRPHRLLHLQDHVELRGAGRQGSRWGRRGRRGTRGILSGPPGYFPKKANSSPKAAAAAAQQCNHSTSSTRSGTHLGLAVAVLAGAQRVGHPLKGVHKGAGKVVGGVALQGRQAGRGGRQWEGGRRAGGQWEGGAARQGGVRWRGGVG